jgi:hypothetical protein
VNDAAVTVQNNSGPSSLTALRFEGKKTSLDLTEASAGMQAASSK